MDIREELINTVLERLTGKVEDLDAVADALTLTLDRYEVAERCTDISVKDNSAEGLLRKYIATKRIEGLSEATLNRYWHTDLELINYLQKPIEDVTTYDLRYYLSIRRETVSNRTLDGMRRCYSSFFGWLTAEGYIDRNPCASLKQIKYRREIKKPFTAVEMERLRQACETARDLALVDFLYSTGCRVSEVARLDIMDVDFERGECKVLGKGDKERTVYLSQVALMHLRDYLSTRQDGALFIGKRGRLTKNGIEAILKRLGERSGVEGVHPHRYRRTLATNLLDRGMNIQDVADILGHADLKTTQIYCYISKDNVRASYNKYAA